MFSEARTSTCRSTETKLDSDENERKATQGIPVASGFCFPTRQSTGRGVWRLGRVHLSLPLFSLTLLLILFRYRSLHTHLPFLVARDVIIRRAGEGTLFAEGSVGFGKDDTEENSMNRHPALLTRQSRWMKARRNASAFVRWKWRAEGMKIALVTFICIQSQRVCRKLTKTAPC